MCGTVSAPAGLSVPQSVAGWFGRWIGQSHRCCPWLHLHHFLWLTRSQVLVQWYFSGIGYYPRESSYISLNNTISLRYIRKVWAKEFYQEIKSQITRKNIFLSFLLPFTTTQNLSYFGDFFWSTFVIYRYKVSYLYIVIPSSAWRRSSGGFWPNGSVVGNKGITHCRAVMRTLIAEAGEAPVAHRLLHQRRKPWKMHFTGGH